jgi:predicted DNA-binding transcriptional regulator YafY
MPLNKNALIRYHVIDRCLCNRRRKWTWTDILTEVNKELDKEGIKPIGKTTLFSDLQDIEYKVYQSEIEKYYGVHKKIVYYRYADPDYSIRKQPLSSLEADHLKSAIRILSRFKGMPQFEWLNEMVPLLETKMGLGVNHEESIMSFDNNEDYEGLQHISPFFNAILYKRSLTVSYQDFNSTMAYDISFHPYHLKQYNNRWYVFGHDPANSTLPIINLALDRVKNIEEVSIEYINSVINWSDYFSDIVGVTKRYESIEEVKLIIMDEQQAAYIKTKPLHPSQKTIRKTDNGYETSIKVIPNYELIKMLLSFGNRIKVVSPDSVRIRLKENIDKMKGYY